MKFLLGAKQNMTQIFNEDGKVHPVTLVKVFPMTVVALKSIEKDGYKALKIGYGERSAKRISKPVKGQMNGSNFLGIKEWKTDEDFKVGDVIDLSSGLNEGDKVVISSISKGKGFQGVVKRHGFKGGPRSHGQKHSEREPGSIGGGGRDGGRVAKGKRMAGRMGGDKVTIKGLKIIKVVPELSEVYIRGAIPGRRGTIVEIKS